MSAADVTSLYERRAIPGFVGYLADSEGVIWSLWARNGRKGWRLGNEPFAMKPILSQRYLELQLRLNNRSVHRRVHRLVLQAFVGPCPEGMVGAHNNGDAMDNRASNLRWTTQDENLKDRWRHNRMPFGQVTPEIASKMHDMRAAGMSYTKIGLALGFCHASVWRAINERFPRNQAS